MRCGKFRKNLWTYLDGEALEGLRTLMEEHLAVCPACRREVELARKTDALMGALEAPAPSETFARDVMKRIARESDGRERVRWRAPVGRRSLAFATAAALFIAAATFFYLASGPRSSPPPTTTAEIEILSDMDLLANLDLLEHFDELQMLDEIQEFVDEIPAAGDANS